MELWRLTSYLADPEWGSVATQGTGLCGFVALAAVSFWVFSQVTSRAQGVHTIAAFKAMLIAIFLCLGLTLATQRVGLITYGYFYEKVEDKSRPKSAEKTDDKSHAKSIKFNSAVSRGVVQGSIKIVPKNAKAAQGAFVLGLFVLVLFVALFLIGGGYAFTAVPMPLWGHALAFTVGVGCTEEISKLFAAIVLLSPSLALFSHRRSLLPFVVAGLAFGVGEAIFYFEDYAAASCELPIYLIRASWCVLLHVAWTTIIGKAVLAKFGEVPELQSLRWKSGFQLLTIMLPVAALHGCYDAFLVHDLPLVSLVLGLASLVWASTVWDGYSEPVKLETA